MIPYFKNYLYIILFFILILAIYAFNLPQSLLFTTDLGRDLYHSIRVAQGDLVLIGPKMNFGGYYAGPYFYYLLTPILLLINFDINSVLYFHAAIFSLAVTFFFVTVAKKFSYLHAFLASLTIALLPFFILSSRHPSNGYTYFPFLLFFATLIFLYNFKKRLVVFLLGVLAGLIVNIHPASIFPTFFISLYFVLSQKSSKALLIFLLGGLITFLPLIAFEIKHDFIMTKDTFINNSLNTYINSPGKPQLTLHQNPFISIFLFLLQKFNEYMNMSFYGFFVFPLLIILNQIKTRRIINQNIFLIVTLLSSFSLLFPLLLFHFENHYLFGVMFYIIFASVLIMLNSNFFYLLIIFVLINIYFFPVNLYKDAGGLVKKIDAAVRYSIEKGLVQKDTSFNLIRVADAYARVPTGFEYRFFFRKYGYKPNSEYDYKNIETLLIFAETPFYDIDKFKMWATEEFGREYFINREKYQVDTITIYKISR